MVPKVTDLQFAGVARVILSPLLPVIPGFGAAVVALRCACLSFLLIFPSIRITCGRPCQSHAFSPVLVFCGPPKYAALFS